MHSSVKPLRTSGRALGLALAALALVGACEENTSLPRVAVSSHVAENDPNHGVLWPILLQHCLRSPSCDPMGRFSEGAGQASNVIGAVDYFAESADVVKEGGKDYGGRITLSMFAPRGIGGPAGRPLSLDESSPDLRGPRNRQSWLSIEYRAPSGEPEPYFLAFRSAQLALGVPGVAGLKTQEAIANRTGDYVAAMSWGKDPASKEGDGQDRSGAKIEIRGKAGVLLTGYSIGLASNEKVKNEDAAKRGFEPWSFYFARNLRDDKAALAGLMKAIAAGETLKLTISAPNGVMLQDVIYTVGYPAALKEATAALKDPRLSQPITERCAMYIGRSAADWNKLEVSAADRTCDPRSPEQRQTAGAAKTQPKPVPR
ncbi:MAG: hypothetical protein ABI740_09190 [Alphaproteobacteria bacterium]